MLRHIGKALIATIVLAGISGFGIAAAQTQPAPSNGTTVAQATPKPAAKKPPLIVLHVGSMSTFNVGSSDLALPGQYCTTTGDCGATGQYQFANPITHFDYGAQININKHWYLNYAHNYVDQNIGRVGVPSTVCYAPGPCVAKGAAKNTFTIPYTYQKLNDDRVDDASLNYNAGPVILSGGWHQRARMCCGNPVTSTLANQVMWHDIYFQLAGRAGPGSRYFGKLAGLTVQEEYIPHNTNSVFTTTGPAKIVVANAGSLYHTMVIPNLTLPVGNPNKATLAVYGTYLNNFDYFLNSPIPYYYNQVDWGIIQKWPPMVTLTITDSNLYQHHSGYPYTNSDVINRNKLIVTLDVAIPFL